MRCRRYSLAVIFLVATAISVSYTVAPLHVFAVEEKGTQNNLKEKDGAEKKAADAPKSSVDVVPVPGESTKPPLETETLDAAGEKIGQNVDLLGNRIASVLGPWVNLKLWRGITGLKLLTSFLLLVLVILAERLFSASITAYSRKFPADAEQLLWKRLTLIAVRPPVSALILVYGIYMAISPLFVHFEGAKGESVVHHVAGRLADVGGTIAIIWLVYRLIRAGDVLMQSRIGGSPKLLEIIVRRSRGPIQLLIMLIVVRSLMPVFAGSPHLLSIMTNLLSLLFISTVAWLVTQAVYIASDYFVIAFKTEKRDPFYVRKVQTQIQFLRRLVITLIVVIAVATGMMVFDKVRQLGTSILASAGIVGVIVGLAAQRTLANLLVGLQIAVTQPIRIGDLVTVESETGTIQEIKSTYAVVQTWDQRRLIVPLTYFTEKLFQNLTLSSSELLGTVSIFVDYTVPVEEIRAELHRILLGSSNWDKRSWALNVANLKENSVELTALVSASDAGRLGNLRGEVRERLLSFLQKKFPDGLPKVRAELDIGKGNGRGGMEEALSS